MTKRKRYNMHAAGTRERIDRIVHGAFVTEGTMVAFPPCFPGVTLPVAADECHITALDVAADGIVYAGTSGRAAHLLVGMFQAATQIQEMTLSFIPKLGILAVVLIVAGPWMLRLVVNFTERLILSIPALIG